MMGGTSITRMAVCKPTPLNKRGFNENCQLPFGLKVSHIRRSMQDFLDFIETVNTSLYKKRLKRLEATMMQASFSSLVGEFIHVGIEKHCKTLVKNRYHNGHPDMVPRGKYPDDSIKLGDSGIEIKGSRYQSGWQGHNAEDCWLMVYVYDSNRPVDEYEGIEPKPFSYLGVYGAQLSKRDWSFSGRSETSRRTITASVLNSGKEKMMHNWIYRIEAP